MKKRLIFVPQLPVHMRYQEWWIDELEKEFQKYYDEVITLGKNMLIYLKDKWAGKHISFAPVNKSIQFEQFQINEFLNLKINLFSEDTLFLSDISFPGFFSNILHHKHIENAYAFCHGTSQNNLDYFQSVKDSKWLVESGHSKLFKKVFVATEYHKNKLGWDNVEVIGIPKPPFENYVSYSKELNLISVARDNVQKRNNKLESRIENQICKIVRSNFNTWDEYYKFIALSKIMVITSSEETFGYQVMDAVMNSCIPLAPNKFSYPELLSREYLYDNDNELFNKIKYYLNNDKEYPLSLLNQSIVDDFYDNLISYIKK